MGRSARRTPVRPRGEHGVQPRDADRGRGARRARNRRRQFQRGGRAILHRSVQRVARRAHRVRRLHDLAVLAAIHANRARARAGEAAPAAALPQHVPALRRRDADRAHEQQLRTRVGGDGGGDALDRAPRDALSHACEPRGRLEVLHPVRSRHCAGVVRHDPAVLRGREGARRRGDERAPVDASERREGQPRARRALARIRVPARRLRHEGRLGAAAQLAARRARRGPDSDLGGALRAAAERRGLRGRALQGARRGLVRLAAAGAHADGVRPLLDDRRGLLPLASARHQAAVRVLLDRAHGDHHVRVRHGRAGREFRRAAAHDRALAHEIRDLLRCRPRRAESRLADHGRDPRAHHALADGRMGPDAGSARDLGIAAVRCVRERVPHPHDRDARPFRGRRRSCCSRSALRSPRSSAACNRWYSARLRTSDCRTRRRCCRCSRISVSC